MVVGLGLGPTGAERQLLQPLRVGGVGDVEERNLGAGDPAIGSRVLADADQQVAGGGVQVRGVAGDLQLPRHDRIAGV